MGKRKRGRPIRTFGNIAKEKAKWDAMLSIWANFQQLSLPLGEPHESHNPALLELRFPSEGDSEQVEGSDRRTSS